MLSAASALMLGTTALAQTSAEKCAASKNLASGKYGMCRQKAEKQLLLTGDATKYAGALVLCDQKYSSKWQGTEARFPGMCPTIGDEMAVHTFITEHSVTLATALSGAGLPRCGDGTINVAGEQCDGSDLGGASCASLGYPGGTLACANCLFDTSSCTGPCMPGSQPPPLRTGQTTCYDTGGASIPCAGSGQDGELVNGATRSFTDNGNGTFTDDTTGLMWEKLSDDGSIHDWDTLYSWDEAFAVKIAGLNSANFAGHNDWRLPNVNELHTLVNYGAIYPPAYSVADTACAPACTVTGCSCTQSDAYWTSTTSLRTPSYAWFVSFVAGNVDAGNKSLNAYVRAVR
jgi:hypothetical protein